MKEEAYDEESDSDDEEDEYDIEMEDEEAPASDFPYYLFWFVSLLMTSGIGFTG